MVFFDPSERRGIYIAGSLFSFVLLVVVTTLLSFSYLKTGAHTFSRAPFASPLSHDALEKKIALTFDDGPHPNLTIPLILLLEREKVPATFFLVGEHVLRYPGIARTLVDKGFEIGNHSFSHSKDVHATPESIRQEITATDHAIASVTGHTTMLYRPPFLLDVGFGELDAHLVPNEKLRTVESVGPMIVSADVDTTDWERESVYEADEIYTIMRTGIENGGHVILLHDHGGEGASLEALKRFIPDMKAAGYTFVPVSHIYGLTRETVMPRVEMNFFHIFIAWLLSFWANASVVLYTLGGVLGVVGMLRMWGIYTSVKILAPLRGESAKNALHPLLSHRMAHENSMAVIVPAYNEAANIEATLRSVVRSSVTPTQIVVVDDGSTDDTASIVRNFMATSPVPIHLLQKENGGTKAGALRHAMQVVEGDIVMCIDADTIVDERAFEYLLPYFAEPDVGAVAGKVYPATTKTLVEKLQYLEYVQGQNLDKRVFALGHSVGIVPGAIGAWRKKALEDAGGYSTDTVVEDQDLTLAFLAHGWRVLFEPRSFALTETPSNTHSFFTQRLRWTYGTLQCFYKYRTWLFSEQSPWLGYVVLPNMLFFNIIFPLIAPIIDMIAIAGLFGLVNAPVIITVFCFFLVLDMVFAWEAMRRETHPRYSLLSLVIVQRFFYEYVTAFAVGKSILLALSGNMVRWGTLVRRGAATEAFLDSRKEGPLPRALIPGFIHEVLLKMRSLLAQLRAAAILSAWR